MSEAARAILEALRQKFGPDDHAGRTVAAEKVVREVNGLVVASGGSTTIAQQGSPPRTPNSYAIQFGRQTAYLGAYNGEVFVGTGPRVSETGARLEGMDFDERTSRYLNGVDVAVKALAGILDGTYDASARRG